MGTATLFLLFFFSTAQRLPRRRPRRFGVLLPPERQAEVRNSIEFLHEQELAQATTKDFSLASEKAFASIWDNDDDVLYDKL